MKRSVNLSHTRKPRNAAEDMVQALLDLGYTLPQIRMMFKTAKFPKTEEPTEEQKTEARQQVS